MSNVVHIVTSGGEPVGVPCIGEDCWVCASDRAREQMKSQEPAGD
jgi:hypothetical protein